MEPENDSQKRQSEEKVRDELQRSVKTPSDLQRKGQIVRVAVCIGMYCIVLYCVLYLYLFKEAQN